MARVDFHKKKRKEKFIFNSIVKNELLILHGGFVAGFQRTQTQLQEMTVSFKVVLSPLKSMAWNESSGSIAVLRMMYIFYVTGAVDYADPG